MRLPRVLEPDWFQGENCDGCRQTLPCCKQRHPGGVRAGLRPLRKSLPVPLGPGCWGQAAAPDNLLQSLVIHDNRCGEVKAQRSFDHLRRRYRGIRHFGTAIQLWGGPGPLGGAGGPERCFGYRLHGTCGARDDSYARSYRFTLNGERVLSVELGAALDPYL